MLSCGNVLPLPRTPPAGICREGSDAELSRAVRQAVWSQLARALLTLCPVFLSQSSVLTLLSSIPGWKLSPVVGAVYGPELYAGRSSLIFLVMLVTYNNICCFSVYYSFVIFLHFLIFLKCNQHPAFKQTCP